MVPSPDAARPASRSPHEREVQTRLRRPERRSATTCSIANGRRCHESAGRTRRGCRPNVLRSRRIRGCPSEPEIAFGGRSGTWGRVVRLYAGSRPSAHRSSSGADGRGRPGQLHHVWRPHLEVAVSRPVSGHRRRARRRDRPRWPISEFEAAPPRLGRDRERRREAASIGSATWSGRPDACCVEVADPRSTSTRSVAHRSRRPSGRGPASHAHAIAARARRRVGQACDRLRRIEVTGRTSMAHARASRRR